MSNSKQGAVREFHEAFGHPVALEPTMPSEELVKNRVKWTVDEVQREFLEAFEEGDMVKMYDALVDGLYFIYGTGVVMGLDLDKGFSVVHAANMAKLGPNGEKLYDEDGKVRKPEGWVPPEVELEKILKRQTEDGQVFRIGRYIARTPPGDTLTFAEEVPAHILVRAFKFAGDVRKEDGWTQ